MVAGTSRADSALPVVITTGEPAGIGPELTLMLAAGGGLPPNTVAIGDPEMLRQRAIALGLDVTVVECSVGECPSGDTKASLLTAVTLALPAIPNGCVMPVALMTS